MTLTLVDVDGILLLLLFIRSIDKHHLIDVANEAGRMETLRDTLNLLAFGENAVNSAINKADATQQAGKTARELLYKHGRAEDMLDQGIVKDSSIAGCSTIARIKSAPPQSFVWWSTCPTVCHPTHRSRGEH